VTESKNSEARKPLWILWLFTALWRVMTFILELTERLVTIVLGVVLILVGVMVSLTIIGAVIGIPLIVFGFLLLTRGFF
jgi:uncharacterized membrane protein HdeD (DUF308 family)